MNANKNILIILLIIFVLGVISIKPIHISGSSMEPTVSNGDWAIMMKYSYAILDPKRGDIVIFNNADGLLIIKRIVALPTDFISVNKDGTVHVNPKEQENCQWIPNNKYYVLGDNKNNSIDSRSDAVKYIDKKDILGKIIYKW